MPSLSAAAQLPPALEPLVDDRTGIVRGLESRPIPPHFPEPFALVHALLGDSTAFSSWHSDSAGAGYAFGDADAMLGAAVGEAIERYCGNLVPPGLPRASATELGASGRPHIGPRDLALYSDAQRAADRRIPRFDDDTVIEWAVGTDTDGGAILVPASCVWVSHAIQARPLLHPVIQAGLATERSLEAARGAALREVVERDAMTLAWTGNEGFVELTVPTWFDTFAAGPAGALQPRWLLLPSDTGLPVIGALLFDNTTEYLTLGMGVASDPEAAALKALGEALQLQLFVADLDDEHGAFATAAADPRSPLASYRPDRAYSHAFRSDLSDVVDYGCHLQLHLDPLVQRAFLDELDRSIHGRMALVDVPDGPGDAELLPRFAELGERVITVDVSTDDVRAHGLHVVRVLVPGRYSNAPHGLPFLGGTRMRHPVRRPVPLPH